MLPPRPGNGSLTWWTATVAVQGFQEAVFQIELEAAQLRPHHRRRDPEEVRVFAGDRAKDDHLGDFVLRSAKASNDRAPDAGHFVEQDRAHGHGVRDRLAPFDLAAGGDGEIAVPEVRRSR